MIFRCGTNKRGKAALIIVWHAYVWGNWKTRNEYVFRNGTVTVDEVVEYIKLLSW
jgi:hypothetical protein